MFNKHYIGSYQCSTLVCKLEVGNRQILATRKPCPFPVWKPVSKRFSLRFLPVFPVLYHLLVCSSYIPRICRGFTKALVSVKSLVIVIFCSQDSDHVNINQIKCVLNKTPHRTVKDCVISGEPPRDFMHRSVQSRQ